MTVNSTSYFSAFKNSRRISVEQSLFYFTEYNFVEFIDKLFTLKFITLKNTTKFRIQK